ncbi:MAG: hypothetical protein GYA62_05230 [Bacteroidales bacterium]|nr:hypothetical protein [Bacteroidales bacterium]
MAKKIVEKKDPFKTVVQNLPFHQFEERKEFIGLFKDTVTLGDEEDPDKTFQANIMVDLETGEECYIQNSYSIAKAIKQARLEHREQITSVVFRIEFLGKTTVKGKPFNQFKIGYCLEEEYESVNE